MSRRTRPFTKRRQRRRKPFAGESNLPISTLQWYILRMPQEEADTGVGWFLVLVGGATVAYLLLRPSQSAPATQAAPLPPLEPPTEFPTLGAVATALDNLKTNWRMGRLGPEATWAISTDLYDAIQALQRAGVGDEASAKALVRQIEILREDISDYIQITQTSTV